MSMLMAMVMGGAVGGGGGISSLADLFTGQDGFAYEFDDLSTLWQDTGATTPVTTNGDPIARVDDVSGNGYNATQGVASAQPTFNDSAGIRWANYDGDDRLTIASSAASLAWLHKDVGFGMAALVRLGTTSNPNAAYGILGNGRFSTANTGIYWFYDDRSSQSKNDAMRLGMVKGSAGVFVYDYDSGNGDLAASIDRSVYINTPTSGPMDGRIENVSVGTATKSSTVSSGNASFDMEIGTVGDGVAPLVGRIYQIVVRDEEFTSQELTDIQNYFLSKL